MKKEKGWNENVFPGALKKKNQENDVQKFIDLKMSSKQKEERVQQGGRGTGAKAGKINQE